MATACPTTSAQEFAGLLTVHNQLDPALQWYPTLQLQKLQLRIQLGLSVGLDWGESLNVVALADD
jgi:hypothetical protein